MNENKIKDVNVKIDKYKADREEEKMAEEEEFNDGTNKITGTNN